MKITDGEVMLLMQNDQDRRYAAQQINLANDEIRKLRRKVALLQDQLCGAKAGRAGFEAMYMALRQANPGLPEFRATGLKFADDDRDYVEIHRVFDAAAVTAAEENGFSDPESLACETYDPVARKAERDRIAAEDAAAAAAEREEIAARNFLKQTLTRRRSALRRGDKPDDSTLDGFRRAPNYSSLVWELCGSQFSMRERLAYTLTKKLPDWA